MDKHVDDMYIIKLFDKLSTPKTWMYDAKCRNIENVSEMFNIEIMSNLCSQCPVKRQCLLHAENMDIQQGIFGGVDFSQREEK